MQVVIDIQSILKMMAVYQSFTTMKLREQSEEIIEKATPLPEGHGRLIDADAFLARNAYFADKDFIDSKYGDTLRDLVDNAPTIVKAERIEHDME